MPVEPSNIESVHDQKSCKAWVATLSPSDSAHNLKRIDELLSHLTKQKLPAEDLLEILERLRNPFASAVRTRMPEIENRAMPILPKEAELFLELVGTTRRLCHLYITAAEAAGASYVETLAAPIERTQEGERAVTADSPMIFALQQALDLLASITSAHYRARIAVPEDIWKEIGRLVRIAQQGDCLDIVPSLVKINNSKANTKEDTCRSAFGYALLMRLCNPYRMNALEMSVARYCSIRWGHKLGFKIYMPDSPEQEAESNTLMLGPYAVKLETMRICSSIRMRMESLRTGKLPTELGFPSKLSVENCYSLLDRIHTLWNHGQDTDVIWRRPVNAEARITLGLPKLYRSVEINDQTVTRFLNTVYSYREKNSNPNTIDYTDEEREREQIEKVLKDAEKWEILSENADGFLFLRDRSMPRLLMDQLTAILPQIHSNETSQPFLIGRVSSLRQEYDANHEKLSIRHKVGVKLLPGIPRPIGIQVDGSSTTDAYWLQAQPALLLPESLVLPLATFREGREIFMIRGGQRSRVRLDVLLHRGADFDQVMFTLIR